MKRLLVFALVVSLGNTSLVFAGETLLASATRIAQKAALAQPMPPGTLRAQQGQPSLEASGMKKSKKMMIVLAVAATFVASVLVIDSKVENATPSTAGTRKD